MASKLIVDWDGTITERDSLLAVLEQFGDWEECQRLGDELFAGNITLRQEIDAQFATVTATLDEVVDWVTENVQVRPGLPELVERFHPVVVSSGFHELIDPVLEREGVTVELLANNIEARPDGWRPIWRELPVCAVCGQPCKRSELSADGDVVYVGDGYSDRCAALAAERVLARDALADHLDGLGTSYERFDYLHDVATLLRGTPPTD